MAGCYKKASPTTTMCHQNNEHHAGHPLPSSGAGRGDGRAAGEQPASNGAARGRQRQQGPYAAPPSGGSYRN
jgi:hypothetical protein